MTAEYKQDLRDKFFNECTDPMEESAGLVVCNLTPHNLCEWFLKEMDDYANHVLEELKCEDCAFSINKSLKEG